MYTDEFVLLFLWVLAPPLYTFVAVAPAFPFAACAETMILNRSIKWSVRGHAARKSA